jgi:hypothetical protein
VPRVYRHVPGSEVVLSEAIVAIDGSKFKAVNNRDKNFTDRKLKARMQQLAVGKLDFLDHGPVEDIDFSPQG